MVVEANLLDLPNETMFHIFSYIDANSLLNNVSRVCGRLKHLLSSESNYWKKRLFKKFPDPYPIVKESSLTPISWSDACNEREKAYNRWGSNESTIKYLNGPRYGYAINALQLSNDAKLCFAGCVDKTIMVWNTNEAKSLDAKTTTQNRFPNPMNFYGHNGWIWSISNCPSKNEICSTAFDCTVKLWDIDHCCQVGKENMIKDGYLTVKVRSPALCSKYMDENNIAVGLNNKSVVLIDARAGSISQQHVFHTNPVLCVDKIDEHTIMTCSEDKHLAIFDIRKQEIVNKIFLNDFAMSLDCHDDQVWVGDKSGVVKAYALKDYKLTLVGIFESKHFGKITGLKYTMGAVYSVSTDGFFKIHEPTINAGCIASLDLQAGELTALTQVNDVTAVASANGMVAVWNPDA